MGESFDVTPEFENAAKACTQSSFITIGKFESVASRAQKECA